MVTRSHANRTVSRTATGTLIALVGLTQSVHAQCGDVKYRGPLDGSWFNVESWQTRDTFPFQGPPVAGESAFFTTATTSIRTVRFDQNPVVTTSGIFVHSPGVVFDLQGTTLNILGTLPECFELAVGMQADQQTTLDVLGPGSVNVETFRIGTVTNAKGYAGFHGRSGGLELALGINNKGNLQVGTPGAGVLELEGAKLRTPVAGAYITLGTGSTGDGTFLMTKGASADIQLSALRIGNSGPGRLSLLDESEMITETLDDVRLGVKPGGEGVLSIIGPGSTFRELRSNVLVGPEGSGLVEIAEGSMLIAPSIDVDRAGRVVSSGTIYERVRLLGGDFRPDDPTNEHKDRVARVNGQFIMQSPDTRTERPTAGSLTIVLADDKSQPSKLEVDGPALVGGTLRVVSPPDFDPPIGSRFTVLEARSGIEGRFTALERPIFPSGTTVYLDDRDANMIDLVVDRARVPDEERSRPLPASINLTQGFRDAIAGDFNNDGLQDLAVAFDVGNNEGVYLSVVLNLGTSAAGNWLGYSSPQFFNTLGNDPVGLAVADLNGDGLEDIAILNNLPTTIGGEVIIRLNTGEENDVFGEIDQRQRIFVSGRVTGITALDVNGDGLQDLAITTDRSEIVPTINAKVVTATNQGEADDFDLDEIDTSEKPESITSIQSLAQPGYEGLVVASEADDAVAIHWPNGSGAYLPPVDVNVGADPIEVVTGDVTGDGIPDIVTADSLGGTISLVIGEKTGGEPDFMPAILFIAATPQDTANPRSPVIIDYDNDGDQDITYIADVSGTPTVRVIIQDKPTDDGVAQFFSAVDVPSEPGNPDPVQLEQGDLDGDEVEDLIVVHNNSAQEQGRESETDITTYLIGNCPYDYAGSPALNVDDVLEFLVLFSQGSPEADLAPAYGTFDVDDVLAFLNGFVDGCD